MRSYEKVAHLSKIDQFDFRKAKSQQTGIIHLGKAKIFSLPSKFALSNRQYIHCVKSVRIRSFSGSYFPAFGLNTERYGVSLCI